MKRKIFAFLGAVMLAAGVLNLGVSTGAWACGSPDSNKKTFLGLRAWYYELSPNDDGKGVCDENFTETTMPKTIGLIASNILFDLFYVVGLLGVGFVIYSGFMMVTAGGEIGKVEKAKSNLTAAITGVIIALLATVIISIIRAIFWK